MIIEELTMPAFIKALTKTRTIIVPFGAVEEHGQHLPLGTDTIAEIRDETIETENDSHAGEVETSLMLHPRPAHINGTSQEEYPSFPTPILARDKKKFWRGDVWSDPSKASSKKGKTLLQKEVEALLRLDKQNRVF